MANWLTLLVIFTALGLLVGRLLDSRARAVSRLQDYVWPVLIAIPFLSGYIASNAFVGPRTYQQMMLVHIYAGNLIMLMILFTKVAHCVLMPLSQLVTSIAWKFPAGAGDRVIETLDFAGRPTWMPKARLATGSMTPEPAMKGDGKR